MPGPVSRTWSLTACSRLVPCGISPACTVVTLTVTFTGPRGNTHTVAVRDPGAREFVRGLRQGEEVDITYSEAFAIRVEPAAR